MKALVVGSFCPPKDSPPEVVEDYKTRKPQFDAAARAIGQALASRNHDIVVGVHDWALLKRRVTAASFVVEGASSAEVDDGGKRHRVYFYGPRSPEAPDTTENIVDTLGNIKALDNLDLDDSAVGRVGSKPSVIPNVADVDVVILLAGAEGTSTIGYSAYSMNKPVVAVTGLGGAAQLIYAELLEGEYSQFLKQNSLTGPDLRALQCYWKAKGADGEPDPEDLDNAARIVQTAEKLARIYSQLQHGPRNVLWGAIVGVVVLLLLWLGFYVGAAQCPTTNMICVNFVNFTFFLLLYFSALLGAGLRNLIAYHENKVSHLTPTGILVDCAISLVVAFGLALVYMIGGISFTGEVVVLQTVTPAGTVTNTTSNTFATIALSMAVLGLAAGYLLPLKQLSDRLEGVVSQEGT